MGDILLISPSRIALEIYVHLFVIRDLRSYKQK